MARLKGTISKPLNFEMAATEQMLDIALRTKPHASCLVPEKRTERTTEGGLDVVGQHDHLKPFIAELGRAGVRVSLFIEPARQALEAAASLKAPVVELHTGAWCDAVAQGEHEKAAHEFERLRAAAALTSRLGLECHAGHGLDYDTARQISALPGDPRTQHRAFPDRRGDLRRACREPAAYARGDGRGAPMRLRET